MKPKRGMDRKYVATCMCPVPSSATTWAGRSAAATKRALRRTRVDTRKVRIASTERSRAMRRITRLAINNRARPAVGRLNIDHHRLTDGEAPNAEHLFKNFRKGDAFRGKHLEDFSFQGDFLLGFHVDGKQKIPVVFLKVNK